MTARSVTVAKLLRILCAVVLLSLGFAHRPVEAAAPLASYDEAYRLPDGTFAEICTEGRHEEAPAAKPACEVCLLSASIMLPTPNSEGLLTRWAAFLLNPLGTDVHLLGVTSVTRPRSRAPPQVA